MSNLTEQLVSQGARPAPPGAALPILTHGSVPGEYAAATSAWALVARPNLGTLLISGADAQSFLVRILSGDVRALEPGQGHRNMLLSPKGKVLHLFTLVKTEAGFEVITAPSDGAKLVADLDLYLFGEDVQFEDRSEQSIYLDVVGPTASDALQKYLGAELPADEFRQVEFSHANGAVHLLRRPVAGHPGFRLRLDAPSAVQHWQSLCELGATPLGLIAFDSLRAECAHGLWGVDVDDTIYPQEARLEDAFSLTKGCYIGQEVVAKIDTYGGMNKRLMLLTVHDDDPVEAGTRLLQSEDGAEARDLGVVTTWAYSFALDRGVVLAYVKRKHQAEGTRFQLGSSARSASIVELPSDNAHGHAQGQSQSDTNEDPNSKSGS